MNLRHLPYVLLLAAVSCRSLPPVRTRNLCVSVVEFAQVRAPLPQLTSSDIVSGKVLLRLRTKTGVPVQGVTIRILCPSCAVASYGVTGADGWATVTGARSDAPLEVLLFDDEQLTPFAIKGLQSNAPFDTEISVTAKPCGRS